MPPHPSPFSVFFPLNLTNLSSVESVYQLLSSELGAAAAYSAARQMDWSLNTRKRRAHTKHIPVHGQREEAASSCAYTEYILEFVFVLLKSGVKHTYWCK